MFHKQLIGITLHPDKASFLSDVNKVPIKRTDQIACGVHYNARKHFKYVCLPLDRTYDQCKHGVPEYLHEMFLKDAPAKLFFDVNIMNVTMTEDEKDLFLQTFYNFVVKYVVLDDFFIEPEQFIVMESLHTLPGDVKISFHIVINNGWHFKDNVHVGRVVSKLLSNIRNNDGRKLLTREFHVNCNVYGEDGRLRCIGGSNWEDPKSIFKLRGWFSLADRGDRTSIHFVTGPLLASLTFAQYKSCFVQYVTSESRLVDLEQGRYVVQMYVQDERNAVAFDINTIKDKNHATYIRQSLEQVKKVRGNEAATYESCIFVETDQCYEILFGQSYYCQYDGSR